MRRWEGARSISVVPAATWAQSGDRVARIKLLAIIAAFCAVCLVAFCVLIGGGTVSWNQCLTIIIDRPAGEVRGASVVEVTNSETMGVLVLMAARGVHTKVRGEAVAVEVVPGRWLFVLLDGLDGTHRRADQLLQAAFDLSAGVPLRERSYANNMTRLQNLPLDKPAPLPTQSYPLLVTFDDARKPETVRVVDPMDLSATFGVGVSLRGMTQEVTNAVVTEGVVETVLTWLGPYPETRLYPTISPTDFSIEAQLHHGNFRGLR